jgi:Na+/proline symporter
MINISLSFMLLFIIVGIYAGKHIDKNSTEGYFLSNRSLNRWQVGISAGATANSGFIVVGAVGMGYSMGMSALLYPLAWLLGDLAFWYFFAEKIRTNDAVKHAVTVPQALAYGRKDGAGVRVLAALVILVLLTLYSAAQFIASVKVVSAFTDITANTALILSFVFVMAYTVWGGFKSSVYTDVLQGIMMLLLTAGMIVWGLVHIGGIDAFVQTVRAQGDTYASLLGDKSLGAALAFVLGFAFTGFGFSISQPQVVTRIFAAADEKEVKAARWIYIGFLHFTWMGMVLIGMLAKGILPDLSDGEMALPILAKTFLPDIAVGFVFAGMVATILSSVDSLLVASASALSIDFGFYDKLSPNKRLLFFKFSVLFIGFLALMFAFFSQSTVFAVIVFAVSVMTAAIGSAMVLVVLNKVTNSTSLLFAIVIGLGSAVTWRLMGWNEFINEGFIGFILGIAAALAYEKKRLHA